jgi:hypothetical protein
LVVELRGEGVKIVKSENTKTKLRADLARLSTQKFLEIGTVQKFLNGDIKLDYETSKVIHSADKAISYIERFKENGVLITKSDHIIALLCIFSEDSMGTQILSDEFYEHTGELQAYLDSCKSSKYSGVHSAVEVMEFLGVSEFMQGNPYDVWYLLYNFFLLQSGISLILEDTDTPGSAMLLDMKYKVEAYANKLH